MNNCFNCNNSFLKNYVNNHYFLCSKELRKIALNLKTDK